MSKVEQETPAFLIINMVYDYFGATCSTLYSG